MAVDESRRRYETLPGRNRFCCNGRLMMSRQGGVFYFTLVLILGTMALFFAFDARYLWTDVSPAIPLGAVVLLHLVLANLLRTSFSDPGVLPRATSAEAMYTELKINEESGGDGTVNGYRAPPRMREVEVNGQIIKLKYCFTCKLFRPPRSSHCSICDNCILNFDHHCPWVGNCVGSRNYRHFFLFIVFLSLLCIYVFAGVVVHLVMEAANSGSFLEAVKESPASLVVALICFFSIWSVLGLAGFHSYLVATAQTTNEDIKGTFSPKRNPANQNPYSSGGFFANCAAVICAPTPPSVLLRTQFVGQARGEVGLISSQGESLIGAEPVSGPASRDTGVTVTEEDESSESPEGGYGSATTHTLPPLRNVKTPPEPPKSSREEEEKK